VTKLKELEIDEVFYFKKIEEVLPPFCNLTLNFKATNGKDLIIHILSIPKINMNDKKIVEEIEKTEKELHDKLVKAGKTVIFGDVAI
jgi:hypothetical protein